MFIKFNYEVDHMKVSSICQKISTGWGVEETFKGLQWSFPKHWGQPPQIQTCDFVELPGGYGHGSSTLKFWIEANLKKDEEAQKVESEKFVLPTTEEVIERLPRPIPEHWGTPPKRPYDEPRYDFCLYSDGYGAGPAYLGQWIASNLRKDQENL